MIIVEENEIALVYRNIFCNNNNFVKSIIYKQLVTDRVLPILKKYFVFLYREITMASHRRKI